MIEDAIVAIVAADPAIVAVIGTRIGPRPMPALTDYPFITYFVVTGREHNHQGGGGSLIEERIQFDIYATDFDALRSLRMLLRDRFNGVRVDAGGVSIRACIRQPGPQGTEPESDGSELLVYRQTDDYTFKYVNN